MIIHRYISSFHNPTNPGTIMLRYIGVSCFMRQTQVQAVLDMLPSELQRRLMVGTVVSDKTLEGKENSLPHKFPQVHTLRDIYGTQDPRALNLVHYARKVQPVDEALWHDMERIIQCSGPNLHGMQFNFAWPSIGQLERFKCKYPGKSYFVLQISPSLLGGDNWDPKETVRRLGDYDGIADAILFDRSRGMGDRATTDDVRRFFDLVCADERCDEIALGFAGGLSAETLPAFAEIIQDYEANFDAENALRSDTSAGEALDMEKVRSYLTAAIEIVG